MPLIGSQIKYLTDCRLLLRISLLYSMSHRWKTGEWAVRRKVHVAGDDEAIRRYWIELN